MTTRKQHSESAQLVGREFVRLYYKVMNSYSAYLYLFYEQDSTVVISEAQDEDKPLSMQAATQETVQALLSWMYSDVSVNLLTCVPQISLNGSIMLLVSGRIKRRSYNAERFFTQALLLRKQTKGYYVKTDTLHVLSHSNSILYHLLPLPGKTEQPPSPRKNEIPTEPTQKALVGKHQPTDSCFGYHVELNMLMETTHSPRHENLITAKAQAETEKGEVHAVMTPMNRTEGTSRTIPKTIESSQPVRDGKQTGMHSFPDGVSSGNGACRNPMSAAAVTTPRHRLENKGDEKRSGSGSPRTPDDIKLPELTSLFAARLPMGITPAAVNVLFAAHGKLRKDNPIRVFTGLTNCYACVNFESECEMRKALEANVSCGGSEIVTEIWRPRDRRGRRIGRDFSSRVDTSCRPCLTHD